MLTSGARRYLVAVTVLGVVSSCGQQGDDGARAAGPRQASGERVAAPPAGVATEPGCYELGASVSLEGRFITKRRFVPVEGGRFQMIEEEYSIDVAQLAALLGAPLPDDPEPFEGISLEVFIDQMGRVTLRGAGAAPTFNGTLGRREHDAFEMRAVRMGTTDTSEALLDGDYELSTDGALVATFRGFVDEIAATRMDLHVEGDAARICAEVSADGPISLRSYLREGDQ